MKLSDLNFERVGCCGEYLNATTELSGGRKALVTDHEDGTYTVAVTKDGILVPPLLRGVSAEEVEAIA